MLPDNRHGLSFAFSEPPALGQRLQIIPGIDWIRLKLPFALDHVNCWFLHSEGDTCLIDTGIHSKSTLDVWEQILKETGLPQKLVVTHFHPDHSGLAGWFANQGCEVISSKIEWGVLNILNEIEDEPYQNIYAQWYTKNGVEQSYVDAVHTLGNVYKSITVPPPPSCEFLRHGDTVKLGGRQFNVMTGQGHSPDMLMLYSEQDSLLIAADQILPSITPNVSLMPATTDANPLGSFLSCIERLRELPEKTLVLPSHGLPFTGLHHRIDFLLEHHRLRLGEIEQALSKQQTAAALFSVLFKRKLDNQQVSFALGETLAHLHYLINEARVEVQCLDGVDYFQAIS